MIDAGTNISTKVDVLLGLRKSLIAEVQEFRTTMSKLIITTNGVIILFIGWVITKIPEMDQTQRWLFTAGILVFASISFFITQALESHYQSHAKAVNRINLVLGAFASGVFVEGESLFPKEWQTNEEQRIAEPVFKTSYIATIAVTTFSIVALWVL